MTVLSREVKRKDDPRIQPVIDWLYRRGWRVVRLEQRGGYLLGGSYVNPYDEVKGEWHDRPVT